MRAFRAVVLTTLYGLFIFDLNSYAQSPSRNRVNNAVDDRRTVLLPGNRHPLARAEFDAGAADTDYKMQRMILALQPDREQREALDTLIQAQLDPSSPEYHRWLTPDAFAERFGVSQDDVDRVTEWLSSHGFDIEEVPAGRRSILFNGTAGQVANAFHTAIHVYNVDGVRHHANAPDPQIPEALANVVAGTVTIHDFPRTPMHVRIEKAAPRSTPEYTSGSTHYLVPADFATIYDVAALYSSS